MQTSMRYFSTSTRFLSILFIHALLLVCCLCSAQQVPDIPADAKPSEIHTAALQALQSGSYEAAVALFKKVLELEPEHQYAWNNLGRVYLRMGKENEAIEAFKKQIEINAFDEFAYNNLGVALLNLGQNKQAEEAFRKQIEINPLDKWAHMNLGKIMSNDKPRWKEAVEELEIANKIDPSNMQAKAILAMAYRNVGEIKKSEELMSEVTATFGPPRMMASDPYAEYMDDTQDAQTAEATGRIAVNHYSKELTEMDFNMPSSSDSANTNQLLAAWASLGNTYLRAGKLQEAEKYLHAAWTWTQAGSIAEKLGQTYERLGDKKNAILYYRYAIDVLPMVRFAPASAGVAKERRGRLARLLGGDAKVDGVVRNANSEMSLFRTIRLGKAVNAKGNAELSLVFTNGQKLKKAKFLNGEEKLAGVDKILGNAKYPFLFPDETAAAIVIRGMVDCSIGGCVLVVIPPVGPMPLSPPVPKLGN
jgi:tetratricopeptide (TPR) repeat protein